MNKRTNGEWITLLKSRDEQAEQELWELLYRFGISAARHYGQADDWGCEAASEAYMDVLDTGVHQFKDRGPFEGYCRIIVINKLRDRLPRGQDPEPLSDETAAPGLQPNPENILEKLQPCIRELSSLERQVIDLIHLHEKDPETVARQLTLTRNYVNVTAFRARKKLKACLNRLGYNASIDLL